MGTSSASDLRQDMVSGDVRMAGLNMIARRRVKFSGLTVLLDTAFALFIGVSVVGLNPLTDRASGSFNQFGNVGSQQYWILYAGLAVVSLVAIGAVRIRAFRLFHPALWLLFAWAAITIFASVTPASAMTDLVKQFVFMLGVASFFVLYKSERALLNALKVCLFIIVLADLAAVLTVPSLAIHQRSDATETNIVGAWRGLHEHKGKFGELLAVACLIFYSDWRNSRKISYLLFFFVCYIFTFPADSKISSAGVLLTIILIEAIYFGARTVPGLIYTTVLAPVAAAIGIGIAFVIPRILEAVFGDTTLSGRTKTWSFLWDYSLQHPIMGSGFSSFFIGKQGPLFKSGDYFLMAIGNAHNAFLDMLVTIGWPGLVITIFAFVIFPVAQGYSLLRTRPEARVWLTLVVFAAVAGATSISYFQPQRALGLSFVLGYFGLRWLGSQPRNRPETRWQAPAPTPPLTQSSAAAE